MHLTYIDGSPFARMARVLIREHGLDATLHEITEFPPPDDYLAVNPLGHVPVLEEGGQRWFTTRIVLAVLLSKVTVGEVAAKVARPGHGRQDE